jgi:sugar phosphate isomerase/epimerase
MMNKLNLAVQLYSPREDLGTDLEGTLHRIAAADYTGVELYSYDRSWDRSAAELRSLLDAAGLKAVSLQTPWLPMPGCVHVRQGPWPRLRRVPVSASRPA